ncbi:MAG: transcription-repair coupling factor [Eubacteriales bacterium]|nr:transcription-repair coupling factor [Eubacteriales bacterium]
MSILDELKDYRDLDRRLHEGTGPFALFGCSGSQKISLLSELGKDYGWKLLVCTDEKEAAECCADFRSFSDQVYLYPARDLLFYSSDIHGSYISRERITALRHLIEDEAGVLVTTIDGLMDRISAEETITKERLTLREGMIIDTANLSTILVRLGYERVAQVELAGQFALRGGIVDLYPMTAENPLRIEFFDDEIDTIRSFDIGSQRSIERVEEAEIYPAGEGGKDDGVSLLSYFKQDALLILDEPQRLFVRAETIETEFRESMSMRLEKGLSKSEEADLIFSKEEVFAQLSGKRVLMLTGLDEPLSEFGVKEHFHIQVGAVQNYRENFDLLIEDLRRYQKDGYRVSILTPSHTRVSRLAAELRDYELRAYCPDEGMENTLKPGEIEVICGNLRRGFSYPELKYVLITESDMFGSGMIRRRKKQKKKYEGRKIAGLSELSVGDYVVHESHGIGIYKGLEHIEREGSGKDYIRIEYADGGNLYLPATKLELVQKFAGSDAKKPKLNKLNGGDWQKTKQRVTKSVRNIAKELVELYAKRSRAEGFRYEPDTVWQREFEELFPFEETEDQLHAIEAVKADMESGKIMDRLICGDVGFGKTEIAVRAAFKAVQEGRQVVYLVPTTILAQQHYNTFASRMQKFPVKIGMMSRFKTAAENKKTAEGLKKGTVDIVIGTHRVLSEDVDFKNLGLLIIDEEQRFGVAHKEKIKKLKTNVDVLTLTATPIPRTLHMSLAGIRDLSVLEEPPVDRLPIQTYVMEYNEELVREAVMRETGRGGQVYYVYNRVKDIAEKTARLQQLMPGLNIEFAHGQMNERELEDIMMRFVSGELDVLVSTTIIETGLDIPNANTLIIDGAERMGLSQLYQIRGRVGRSSRTSYAFLMYRKNKILSEEADKRLKAIREFTELGSGIRIAMRDLEIRGAGNVLGAEQHGQMEAVGYDLYCKLLNMAVRALKGEAEEEDAFVTSIDCDADAYIPASYIPNESQKLDIYKKISGIESEDDYMDVLDELQDRFGDIPRETMTLIDIARLRAYCHKAYVTELSVKKNGFRMEMYPRAKVNSEAIPELIVAERGRLKFLRGQNPKFVYEDRQHHSDCSASLKKAEELVRALSIS